MDKEFGKSSSHVLSAERAILRYLYDVPKHEGFDEANYLMERLSSLYLVSLSTDGILGYRKF